MTAASVRTLTGGWPDAELADVIPSNGQTTWQPGLPGIAASAMTTGDAVFVYVGLIVTAQIAAFIRFSVNAGGTGAQTAEVALCSTPLAPNGAGQTLTKIAANGTLSALTGTGAMANTLTMAAAIPARTHLWAGLRTALASSQPTVYGVTGDGGSGQILKVAASGVLTGAGPFTGTTIADTGVWMGPRLIVTTF
jgi:hypothetical protein